MPALELCALEVKAVDQYLDNEEWDVKQSGGLGLQGFPPFAADSEKDRKTTLSSRLGV